jgi:hypothetical protein
MAIWTADKPKGKRSFDEVKTQIASQRNLRGVKMTRFRVLELVLALVSLASVATASADTVARTEPKQWKIQRASALAGEATVMSNTSYGLSNGTHEGWLTDANVPDMKGQQWQFVAAWQFIKRDTQANIRDHRARPAAGESMALLGSSRYYKTSRGTRKGEYLVASGSSTSNPGGVKWIRDSSAAFEWKIEIDPMTHRMSLYNTKVGRFLGLPNGGWVDWLPSGQTSQPAATHDATVWLTGQPPVSGFIPFIGSFGGGPGNTAVLTEVRNHATGPPLSFIKPGHSSNECGNLSAIIQLGPGEALSAAQMAVLYGSAMPSLANRIPFLACAATNASVVFVNVKYRDH